jgi:hypothetical protein
MAMTPPKPALDRASSFLFRKTAEHGSVDECGLNKGTISYPSGDIFLAATPGPIRRSIAGSLRCFRYRSKETYDSPRCMFWRQR